MARIQGEPGMIRVMTSQGLMCAERLAPGLFRSECSGVATVELCEPIAKVYEREIANGNSVIVFADASTMLRYDEDFRRFWAHWLRKHQPSLGPFHMLVSSSVVAVGAAMANLTLGDSLITTYSRRDSFEQALHRTVSKANERSALAG